MRITGTSSINGILTLELRDPFERACRSVFIREGEILVIADHFRFDPSILGALGQGLITISLQNRDIAVQQDLTGGGGGGGITTYIVVDIDNPTELADIDTSTTAEGTLILAFEPDDISIMPVGHMPAATIYSFSLTSAISDGAPLVIPSNITGAWVAVSGTNSNAVTIGLSNVRSGARNLTVGNGNSINGFNSLIIGNNNNISAEGDNCAAIGSSNIVTAPNAFAVGSGSIAVRDSAIALGGAVASGGGAIALGASTAQGDGATALGFSRAVGTLSYSEGNGTLSAGENAHAEGNNTIASGKYAHAEGVETTAGRRPHDFTIVGTTITISGSVGTDYGNARLVWLYDLVGDTTYISPHLAVATSDPVYDGGPNETTFTIDAAPPSHNVTSGKIIDIQTYAPHAEGAACEARGDCSHVEGVESRAVGEVSHAEGSGVQSIGESTHAEGSGTEARGETSHAEGDDCVTYGDHGSHAEGADTEAAGRSSHTEGSDTRTGYVPDFYTITGAHVTLPGANATDRFSDGDNVLFFSDDIQVEQEINSVSFDGSDTSFDVNSGSGIPENGQVVSTTKGRNAHAEGQQTQAVGLASHAEGSNTTTLASYSHAEGYNTVARGEASHAEGANSKVATTPRSFDSTGSLVRVYGASLVEFDEGFNVFFTNGIDSISQSITNLIFNSGAGRVEFDTAPDLLFSGTCYTLFDLSNAHAEGSSTRCFGNASHAEGSSTIAKSASSHAEGSSTKATGTNAHAEGLTTEAAGNASHAEGTNTHALGDFSHAEGGGGGNGTTAAADYAHAEGKDTTAYGEYSHTEGSTTMAEGEQSHAEGFQSRAIGETSHVEGTQSLSGGENTHAEGAQCLATGIASHAEGAENVSGMTPRECSISGTTVTITNEDATAFFHNGDDVTIFVTPFTTLGIDPPDRVKIRTISSVAFSTDTTFEIDSPLSFASGQVFNHAIGESAHSEGANCIASGICAHAQGANAEARLRSQDAISAGAFSAIGDAQATVFIMRGTTLDATPVVLTDPEIFTIKDQMSYMCTIDIIARTSDGLTNWCKKSIVLIERSAGTVRVVDQSEIDTLGDNPDTISVLYSANDTNKSLSIQVTGSTNVVRWVVKISAVEIGGF